MAGLFTSFRGRTRASAFAGTERLSVGLVGAPAGAARTSRRTVRFLAAATLAVLCLPALAQDKPGPNVDTTALDAAGHGVATLVLAHDLYRLGTVQGDAMTVLAAAKLAASVNAVPAEPATLDPARISFVEGTADPSLKRATLAVQDLPIPMTSADTTRPTSLTTFFTATSEAEGAAEAPLTPDAMFARARELAADDDSIHALIDDALAEGSAGPVSRINQGLSRLASGQTDVWEIPYSAASRAEVAVVGDGDTNLDVAVTDEDGNLICFDSGWSDRFFCNWTPARDGYFLVTVENLGNARNSYVLLTN